MNVKKAVRLFTVLAAILCGGVGYEVAARRESAETMACERVPTGRLPVRRRCVFASFKDGDWATGWGTVRKILPDDTMPPCHQRFLLVDSTGETLLVANNIDRWPRLANLHPGDLVEFRGEFKDTERGYLLHWTHPDVSGRHPGGYVRKISSVLDS